jgi:hypothetical protein
MYMHKNSNRRSNSHQPDLLAIRLPAMPRDEKAAFVESTCAVLNESRFGPGRTCQLVVDLTDRPELEPAVFYDLTDEGLIPCYAISPHGRAGYQVVEAEFRKAVQMGLVTPHPNGYLAAANPATQGRGSP